jgi:hypothetical protein
MEGDETWNIGLLIQVHVASSVRERFIIFVAKKASNHIYSAVTSVWQGLVAYKNNILSRIQILVSSDITSKKLRTIKCNAHYKMKDFCLFILIFIFVHKLQIIIQT